MSVTSSAIADTKEKSTVTLPVLMLLFYILVEFGRPKILSSIRPAVILEVGLLISLMFNRKKVALVLKEGYFKIYVLLMILMAVHVFIAANNYYAYMQMRLMLTYFLFGISFCVFVDDLKKLYLVLTFVVLVMILCAANRLAGGIFGLGGGITGDTNDFALALNVALPISFFMGRAAQGRRRWFFWGASVLFIFANMAAASRGGFVGLVAVAVVCWSFLKHKFRVILVIAVLAGLAWSYAAPGFKAEIDDLGDAADSRTGRGRIELWKIGWRAFLDNPVLGVGQGNMPVVMGKYQRDEKGESAFGRDLYGRAIHSVYFTLLPELGLVGLMLFGLMMRDLFQKYRKIRVACKEAVWDERHEEIGNLNLGLIISLLAFFITGTFLSAFYYPQLWIISALLVNLFLVSSKTVNGIQA